MRIKLSPCLSPRIFALSDARPRPLGLLTAALLATTLLPAMVSPGWAAVYVDPPMDPAGAEARWRWIGELTPTATGCPSAGMGRWSSRPLSTAGAVAGLDRFCVYEFIGTGSVGVADESLVTSLVGPGGLASVAPDRMAVTAVASSSVNVLLPVLQDQLEEQAGALDLPVVPGAPQVRVTLIDTSPTTGMEHPHDPENSHHGSTLRLLLEHLLCGSTGCVAEFTSRLALAYTDFNTVQVLEESRDDRRGGHVGTIGELAEAIAAEIAAWREHLDPLRLVLNLSVGWDERFGGNEPTIAQMPPDVRAVYRAIQWASCEGALVVAAAGNRADNRDPHFGPLLPAAWAARQPTPPGGFCDGMPSQTPIKQLLHSAGGVNSSGISLTNARNGAEPPLVAYADHVSISDPRQPGIPTPILTGSSVAALLVSANAAAGAYYRPTLDFDSILDNIYLAGTLLPRAAESCIDPPCDSVSYVSICQTLQRVCAATPTGQPGGLCPIMAGLVCPARNLEAPSLSQVVLAAPNNQLYYQDFSLDVLPYEPTCGQDITHDTGSILNADPCPSFQRYGIGSLPFVGPQPNADPCPSCLIEPDGALTLLRLEIDLDPGSWVSSPTLTLCPNSLSASSASLNFTANLYDGDTVEFKNLPPISCGSAQVSFTLNGQFSATSSVLITQ